MNLVKILLPILLLCLFTSIKGQSNESWCVDKIEEYKTDKKLNWVPSKLSLYVYGAQKELTGTILYNNYSSESGKYDSRVEYRYLSKQNSREKE